MLAQELRLYLGDYRLLPAVDSSCPNDLQKDWKTEGGKDAILKACVLAHGSYRLDEVTIVLRSACCSHGVLQGYFTVGTNVVA